MPGLNVLQLPIQMKEIHVLLVILKKELSEKQHFSNHLPPLLIKMVLQQILRNLYQLLETLHQDN